MQFEFSDLDLTQKNILSFILNKTVSISECTLIKYSFTDKQYFYFSSYKVNTDFGVVDITYNLPTKGNTVFFAMSKGDVKMLSNILSNIEEYQYKNILRFSETMYFPNGGFSEYCLFLPTEVSIDLQRIPHYVDINNSIVNFCFVIPLTKEERMYKEQHGYDALLDLFDEQDKKLWFNFN